MAEGAPPRATAVRLVRGRAPRGPRRDPALDLLLSEYHRRFPDADDGATVTWHFDEIQVVPGWERFVRRLLDAERTESVHHRIVGGPPVARDRKPRSEAARGRCRCIPSVSKRRCAIRGGGRPDDPAALTARERAHLERALLDWLDAGGFPRGAGAGRVVAAPAPWRLRRRGDTARRRRTPRGAQRRRSAMAPCGICWATRAVCSASRSSARRCGRKASPSPRTPCTSCSGIWKTAFSCGSSGWNRRRNASAW